MQVKFNSSIKSDCSMTGYVSVTQVTTHGHLPSSSDYDNISKELGGMDIFCLFLQEFDSELDFTNKIRYK